MEKYLDEDPYADDEDVPEERDMQRKRYLDHKEAREARGQDRGRPKLGIFHKLIKVLFVVALAALSAVIYLLYALQQPGPNAETRPFVVPLGFGLSGISKSLADNGFIESEVTFRLGAILYRRATSLKAGEYEIPAKASPVYIINQITEGRVIERSFTAPEGFSHLQIAERLEVIPELSGTIQSLPVEGKLLPATLHYIKGEDKQSIIDRMHKLHEEALQEIWGNRSPRLALETPDELVILASIVEKETGLPAERPRIAAVFLNRLRRGMRLQSDPTIIYGITKGKKLGRGLRVSEIKKKTPYNTYKINGLPPTAIANPGIDAMKAVASALETDELYFVADGTGGHAFAKTLKEHNRNVAKWRKIEAARASRDGT